MKRNLIKKAAICGAAVLCAGSFGTTEGITGVNVYAETEEISRDMTVCDTGIRKSGIWI